MPGPVKIYDRPERTGPSPALIVVILLVVLVAGYFLYRTFYHPAPPAHTFSNADHVPIALWREVKPNGEHERIAV